MPSAEGPQRATLVTFFYRQGKTIKLGSKGHITGMMRHVNVEVNLVQFEAMVVMTDQLTSLTLAQECAHSHMALYLVSRFHGHNPEPFPDLSSREGWYNT
jgi:hypothetical protein